MKEPIVAVERQKSSLFLDEVYDLGVPVIIGNGRNRKVLEEAGVRHARSLILATDDDLVNLDAALTARDLNPSIKLTVRLFDDTLATKFASAFQIPAISSAQVSAPAFIASATNRKVYHQFQLDGEHLHLIDITIQEKGLLAGQKVGPVQANLNVNVVMHRGADGVNVNPGHDVVLSAGDSLLVIGPIERLLEMETANRTPPAA
jgi:Trk K+ transport system NAD-binding subunit